MRSRSEYDEGLIKLTNLIAVLGASATSFMLLVLVYYFGWPVESNRWYVTATILLYLAVPLTNRYGNPIFAKYLICFVPVLFCFVVSIVNKKIGPIFINDYYVYRLVLLTAAIVPILVFRYDDYRNLILCSLPIFLGLVFFDAIHNLFGVGIFDTGYEDATYSMITFTSVACYVALAGFIYGLKKKTDVYFLNMHAQQEQLKKQNQSLSDLNHEVEQRTQIISKQNETLKNFSTQLKKKVEKRTLELTTLNKELAAQNVKLEQFTFITAHNLKAPVTQLKGLLNLLNYEMLNENSLEIINRMKLSCGSLEDVIADLNKILNIKNSSYIIETLNLSEIIDHILVNLKSDIIRNNISVKTNYHHLIEIASIRAFVYSVLYNLIQNAVKYSDPKKDNSFIGVEVRENNALVHITIEDNGIGFEHAAVKDKIFQLYQRFNTNVQGKGIGLFLVKTQLEMIKGDIRVTSEIDKGTRFEINVPKTLTLKEETPPR